LTCNNESKEEGVNLFRIVCVHLRVDTTSYPRRPLQHLRPYSDFSCCSKYSYQICSNGGAIGYTHH